MSKLVQPPPKFVHSEWVAGCQDLYANSEANRAAAERLILESLRTIDETDKTTQRVLTDSQKRIEQRIAEAKHWENELDLSLEQNKLQTAALDELSKRLSKMIEKLGELLHISQQCLLHRQKRVEIDLVHDDAEKELIKEVEVIQGALALLVRTNEQCIEQIRLNRKAKYNLNKDLADKFQAIAVDTHNSGLHTGSSGNAMHEGAGEMRGKSTSVEEWIDFTKKNLDEAEKQRRNSAIMRTTIDSILQATTNDVNRQRCCADNALRYRIGETREAKEKFEDHVMKVKKEITEMEDNISNLRLSIENPTGKLAALKLTQTRLDNRQLRPNNELCRDLAQFRLVETDEAIHDAIEKLRRRLGQSIEALKALDRKRLEIEHELGVKTNSLFIDETLVAGIRHSMSLHCY